MTGSRRVVVVGGGPAGTMAALAAKKYDPAAHVVLLTDEPVEPYEKPPLSKAVLLGTAAVGDAPIAGPRGVAGHGVVLRHSARCVAIDRDRRELALAAGDRVAYDGLVLATGSVPRHLVDLPPNAPLVHYLRTSTDAEALKPALRSGRHLLIIGGGLIGLEVAASAAALGMRVTVVEVAPRLLPRVCDEHIGSAITRAHLDRGVMLRLNSVVSHTAVHGAGVVVDFAHGDRVLADVVVVGIGVVPHDDLARNAGLTVSDGIVVDEACCTSDPAIFAAGDATRIPGPHGSIRLENWRHAQDHGAVAGANAAGASERYAAVPSFWSEQYDLYLHGVGWPDAPGTLVHRAISSRSMMVCTVADNRLTSALGINAQREMSVARRLIERNVEVDPDALANPAQALATLLKR